MNANYTHDAGEQGLAGWQVRLSGLTDATQNTDASGNFSFTGLAQGSYLISIEARPGWAQISPGLYNSYPSPYTWTGQAQQINMFKHLQLIGIDAYQYYVTHSSSYIGYTIPPSLQSDAYGTYATSGIASSAVYLTATSSMDYPAITGSCDNTGTFYPNGVYPVGVIVTGVNSSYPSSTGNVFGIAPIKLSGKKKFDVRDTPHTLAGWRIYLHGPIDTSVVTDVTGNYEFHGLPWGVYTVSEESLAGWSQTNPPPRPTVVDSMWASSAAITVHLDSLVEDALRYHFTPTTQGGGGGTFSGYSIPAGMQQDQYGSYAIYGSPGYYNIYFAAVPSSRPFAMMLRSANIDGSDYTVLNGPWLAGRTPLGGYLISLEEYHTRSHTYSYVFPNGSNSGLDFGNAPVAEISGNTFYDWNQNLSKDQTESGVGSVKVFIAGPRIDSTMTDVSGNYAFTDLPAGSYLVTEGYRSGWMETSPGTTLFAPARDTIIDKLNEAFNGVLAIASDAYRYNLTETMLGGGGRTYSGYYIPAELSRPNCVFTPQPPFCVGAITYNIYPVSWDSVTIHGVSEYHGEVIATIDTEGKIRRLSFTGNFSNLGTRFVEADSANNIHQNVNFANQQPPPPPTLTGISPTSPANNNNPTVSGAAQPGATVTLCAGSCGSSPLGSGLANGSGVFSIQVSVSDNTTTSFVGVATNSAGSSSCSSSSVTYREDSQAPTAPESLAFSPPSPANYISPHLSGIAEARSTINVFASTCNGSPVATAVTSSQGTFDMHLTVAVNTTTTFFVSSTDSAGNVSACSAGIVYREDSQAPTAPSNLVLTPSSPANNNSPHVTGTAEAGSTVKVFAATCTGSPVATAVATAQNSFEIVLTVADNSITTFFVSSTDSAGNISTCSQGITYKEDSQAPSAPTALALTPSSPANNNSPHLTGTAEARSTVKVYASACTGSPVATAIATAQGLFDIPLTVADNATTTVFVSSTDSAGNVSTCSAGIVYREDSQAPAPPSSFVLAPSSPANNNTPHLSGTTEAGSTVKVYATTCSGSPLATVSATAQGTFDIGLAVADNTTTTLFVSSTDSAGNVSTCSAGIAYREDSQAPTAPSNLVLTPSSPANSNSPHMSGTAEAGSTVKVYATTCSGSVLASAVATIQGTFDIALTVADNTTTAFFLSSTDSAGNASTCSQGITYKEDSQAPTSPSNLVVTPSSPANNNSPHLTGNAEARSMVKVYASACTGSPVASAVATAQGTFDIALSVADNTTTAFFVSSTDSAGNVSTCAAAPVYIEDSQSPGAPTLLSTTPVGPANNNQPIIHGQTEPNATVKAFVGSCAGSPFMTLSANGTGVFDLQVTVADDTTTGFVATATDAAGNTSPCSNILVYQEDSKAPNPPLQLSISPSLLANNNSPTLNGHAQAFSTVRVYQGTCGGNLLATTTAQLSGLFSVMLSVPDNSSTTFSVTATDSAGNTSSCSSGITYVEDSQAPAPPASLSMAPQSPANNNNPQLHGTTEPFATVTVRRDNCAGPSFPTTTANGSGDFSLGVTVQDNTISNFFVTAMDAAGNTSACSTPIAYIENSDIPSTPVHLSGSFVNSRFRLQWDANPESDILRYRIYASSHPAPIALFDSAANSATMKEPGNMMRGAPYYFRITAIDSTLNESDYSNEANNIVSQSINVTDHWNMISVPLWLDDFSKEGMFPTATSAAFAFDGSAYIPAGLLETRKGYWLQFDSSTSISFTGVPVLAESVDVQTGWNLFGAPSNVLPIAGIGIVPEELLVSPFFGYRAPSGYFLADSLQPGHGYWVKAKMNGRLFFSATMATVHSLTNRRGILSSELPPPPPSESGERPKPIPASFALYQNFPNPFNPATAIAFDLPSDAVVTLRIITVLGQVVAIPIDGKLYEAGNYHLAIDLLGQPSGLYFYELQADGFHAVGKMLLVR